jgi:hypothetical protein
MLMAFTLALQSRNDSVVYGEIGWHVESSFSHVKHILRFSAIEI